MIRPWYKDGPRVRRSGPGAMAAGAGQPRAGRRRRLGRRRGSRRAAHAHSASTSRSRYRKLSGASPARAASPPGHLVQFSQQGAALAAIGSAGLASQGQPAQQAGHGGRVEAREHRN